MKETILTDEDLARLIDFYQTHTTRETLAEFHIRLSKLNNLLAEHNIETHSKIKTVLSTDDIVEIIDKYSNLSDTAICKQYHISKDRLHQILEENNIVKHTPAETKEIVNAIKADLTEIAQFYAKNNIIATAQQFHTTKEKLLILFKENNIELHSEAEIKAIKQQKQSDSLINYYSTHENKNLGRVTKKRKQLTEQEQAELVEFHKTNSDHATRLKFGLSAPRYKQILLELNLTKHPIEFGKEIARQKLQTELVEQEVIDFYKTNSAEATRIKFHTSVDRIYQILAKNNIPQHSEQEISNIRKESQIQAFQEKYGVSNPANIAGIKEKKKQTCLKKYGVEYANQAEEVKAKTKQTNLEKYGCESIFNIPEVQEKIHETMLERYGKDRYQQTDEYKEKAKATRIAHFGQNRIPQPKFYFNNITFDSFPELCFYMYHYTLGHNIQREPEAFTFEFEGNSHQYIPDFKVDDKLYEIKGNQFLTESGTWCCIFDHSLDDLYEAKHQCALQNNVIILYTKDYKEYEDWFYKTGYNKENFLIKPQIINESESAGLQNNTVNF